jgi:hypothetical protein
VPDLDEVGSSKVMVRTRRLSRSSLQPAQHGDMVACSDLGPSETKNHGDGTALIQKHVVDHMADPHLIMLARRLRRHVH